MKKSLLKNSFSAEQLETIKTTLTRRKLSNRTEHKTNKTNGEEEK